MLSRERRGLLKQALAAAGLATCAALLPRPVRANAVRVGSPAPPATLVQLDGTRLSTQELTGKVVILTFWATWCMPCRQELPLLSDYAARHAEQGLVVLGFSLDSPDKLPLVNRMAQSLSFPVGLLSASKAPGYGRIWKLPVNFTIARGGILVDDGWKAKVPTWTSDRLESVVTPLLQPS